MISYEGPFYSVETIDVLCPECIATGRAAEKFDGEFQDEGATDADEVMDEKKTDELIHRTPGYCGWQQEYWRAHCNDYCAYLGGVGTRELNQMDILEEVLEDPILDDTFKGWIRDGKLVNGGSFQGYLFQCLHCGKYLLWADID
ncbi:MAG: CbrC family protein [Lachnospiraceae bacterium]|nr:CbrC family protein [Lachnospiraceae bacterium]